MYYISSTSLALKLLTSVLPEAAGRPIATQLATPIVITRIDNLITLHKRALPPEPTLHHERL